MFDWAAMLIGLSYGPAVLLKATVLLVCAWCVHEALRGRNPRWRVLLWRATLVALAVLPIAEWALPRLEVAVVEVAAPPPQVAQAEADSFASPMEPFAPVDAPLPEVESIPIQSAPPPFDINFWMAGHFREMLSAVWVLVSLLLLIGTARAWRSVRTVVKRSAAASADVRALAERVARELGVATRIDIRIAEQPGSPFLTGIRRPVVVLPARCLEGSDEAQLQAVLAHELAHVKTRDPFWMAFARLTASLLWFHPLMWRMRYAHNAACEDVCDSVAATYLGCPETYSKALAREALALFDAQPVPSGVPMLRSAEIVHRLRRIQRGSHANPLARHWVAASLIIAAGLLVTLGSLKLVQARPAEDDTSESGSRQTSDDSSENRVAAAKPDWVLPSIEIGPAGEEPVANVPGLQVELLGVVGIEPTLIAADGRGVEPDVWGTRVEDAIRTYWEDVRERRFGATENGTNVGLLFRLHPEIQSLREYALLDAKLDRGNLASSAVLTVGGPVDNRAEDRVQIMQIRSDQALELPDHMDVTAAVSCGPPLDTYADIPVDAESAAIEMEEWKFTATVRKLPDTMPDGEIPHEDRPEVALTFSAGGPLVNYRVVAIDQQGNPIEPYANPHLDDLRHGHDYTWKFGFPEPISKQSIQGFRLIGYPLQPITWKNVPFVTNTGAREYRPRFSMADIIAMSYEFDGEPWWPEVRQTYGLSQGEAVRFIGADRAPAVQDYIAARRGGNRNLPGAIVMFWDTKLDGWPEESSAYREADVLASETFTFSDIEGYRLKDLPATLCRELTGADLHVAGNVADIVIKGDWSVAFDAPLEDKMHALEQILTKESGERVRIEQTSVEQPVIVASGTLDFRSIPNPPEKEGIYLYGAALGERHVAYGFETSLEGLVRTLSDQTHIAVVNEATDPDGHQYRGIYTMPSARMAPGAVDTPEGAKQLATILQNLSEQTGLDFTTERRTRAVWNVTVAGEEEA